MNFVFFKKRLALRGYFLHLIESILGVPDVCNIYVAKSPVTLLYKVCLCFISVTFIFKLADNRMSMSN